MLPIFHNAAYIVLYEMHPNYAKLLCPTSFSNEYGIPEGEL